MWNLGLHVIFPPKKCISPPNPPSVFTLPFSPWPSLCYTIWVPNTQNLPKVCDLVLNAILSHKQIHALDVVGNHVLNQLANHSSTGFESSFELIRKKFLWGRDCRKGPVCDGWMWATRTMKLVHQQPSSSQYQISCRVLRHFLTKNGKKLWVHKDFRFHSKNIICFPWRLYLLRKKNASKVEMFYIRKEIMRKK